MGWSAAPTLELCRSADQAGIPPETTRARRCDSCRSRRAATRVYKSLHRRSRMGCTALRKSSGVYFEQKATSLGERPTGSPQMRFTAIATMTAALYSADCRLSAMRTPFTSTTLSSINCWPVISALTNRRRAFREEIYSTASEELWASGPSSFKTVMS